MKQQQLEQQLQECLRDFDLIDYELAQGDFGAACYIATKAQKRIQDFYDASGLQR